MILTSTAISMTLAGLFVGLLAGIRIGYRIGKWGKNLVQQLPGHVVGQAFAYDRIYKCIDKPGAVIEDVRSLLDLEGDRLQALAMEDARIRAQSQQSTGR